jgi:hypothetical protein
MPPAGATSQILTLCCSSLGAWRVRNSAVPVILKCKSPLATPAPRGGPSARMCLSTIDQYAEDACAQHRTKHDVHRFKRVAIPHQNCPNVTTTVFESWTFTGSKFSKCRATAFARSALTPAWALVARRRNIRCFRHRSQRRIQNWYQWWVRSQKIPLQ